MAEYSPPTDNVPIFDVTNFAPSGSGLTEVQIASKFLRFPTGQGTETLPALITNLISPTDDFNIVPPSNKNVTIFPDSLTTGKIELMTGTSSSGSINMLTGVFSSGIIDMGGASTTTNINGQTINLANTTEYGDTVNIMSGDFSYGTTNINNAIGNYGIVNIMTYEQSDGNINIGNNSDEQTFKTTTTIQGTVNIETTQDSTSIINIMNGTNSVGEINIGQITDIISPPSTTLTTTNIQGNINIGTQSSSSNIVNIGSELNFISIDGGNVYINNTDITNNTKNLNIGKTMGAFDTNTTLAGKTTINKLATPLTPIYAYPVIGVNQIGYTVKVDVPVNTAITVAQMTLVTLPSVNSGKWLISFLMMIKGGVTNNIGVNTILFKDAVPLTYAVTWVGGTGINSSNNIVLVDDIAVGSTVVYKINTICNQAHATSLAFTSITAPIFTINNAGYLQATRIA
jgi:hypothetical protein